MTAINLSQIENSTAQRMTVTGLETIIGQLVEEDGEGADIEVGLDEIATAMENLVGRSPSTLITVGHVLHWKQFPTSIVKRIGKYWDMKRTLWMKGVLKSIQYLPIDHKGCNMHKDGIHLTDPGAKAYFGAVIDQSAKFFAATNTGMSTPARSVTPLRNDWNDSTPAREDLSTNSKKRGITPPPESTEAKRLKNDVTADLDKRYVKISDYSANRKTDIKTMARIAEEQDTIENKLNLHKIVIQGLTIDGLLQIERGEPRIGPMKAAVTEFMKKLVEIVNDMPMKEISSIYLVNERAMRNDPKKKPMLEVSFGDPSFSVNLRQIYGRMNAAWKRKENGVPVAFRGIFLNPSLNHRTRVRLAVFKAITKAYNVHHAKDSFSAWMIDHLPRPMLKISEKKDDGSERSRVLGYVDAVTLAQNEGLVGDQDLIDAHKLAGRGYGRSLENFFVLLK